MELDRPFALCASKWSESDDAVVPCRRIGELEPSSARREKVLLSSWMCKRFLGRGRGLELGDPVAELTFWAG